MSVDNFARALPLVLAHEGEYSDHPKDPGGATNQGITQRTYDGWRDYLGADRKDVRGISPDEVARIYRAQYWDAVRGDSLPDGVAYAVFDAAVNSGPARAAKWLQGAVGVTRDGVIGPQTLAAVQRFDPAQIVAAVCDARLAFVRGLGTFSTFGRGWTARIGRVRSQGLKFAAGVDAAPESSPLPMAKAESPERTSAAKSTTIQASAAQIATGAGGVATALGYLDGAAQVAVIAGAVLVALLGAWIMRERLRAWAEGWT